VLRRTFGPGTDKVTESWRKLHTEELYNLYLSLSIFSIIRSRRVKWTGIIAQMREKRNEYKLLVRKVRRKETTRKTKIWVGG
jgi:hypothetical protein